jgi:hypothetical protein
MNLYQPQQMSGQIVNRTYGWANEYVYMKVEDRSDGSVQWYRAIPDWSREREHIDYDRAPYIEGTWEPCQEPQ